MARFLVGAAIGAMVTLVAGAALGIHAQDEPEVEAVADTIGPTHRCRARLHRVGRVGVTCRPRSTRAAAQPVYFNFCQEPGIQPRRGVLGLSPFEPWAARAAARWMLDVGRGREFATYWGCR